MTSPRKRTILATNIRVLLGLNGIMIMNTYSSVIPTDPSILASSEEAVMLGNFFRDLVRAAGMCDDTAASEAKALLDQLGIQHGK